MAFREAEISATVDEKFRLIIPSEIVKTRKIRNFVELVNSDEDGGYLITRIYYHKSGIKEALKVRLDKDRKSSRVTIIKAIREKSFSFFYKRNVMLVDKGSYLEILPWPAM